MFGKKPHLSPLKLRKQLLIAESELNRARLSEEWQTIAHGVRGQLGRARTIAVWVSSSALLVAGVVALRRSPSAPRTARAFWLQRIWNGARLASTIWFALRARGHEGQWKQMR